MQLKQEALTPGQEGDSLTAGRKKGNSAGFSSCSWKRLHCRCPQSVQKQASPRCPLLAIGWNLLKTQVDKRLQGKLQLRRNGGINMQSVACFRAPAQSSKKNLKKLWISCACWGHAAGENQIKSVTACTRSLTRQAHWPSSGPPDRPFRAISEQ